MATPARLLVLVLLALAALPFGSAAQAASCPSETFLNYGYVVSASEPIPSSVSLTPGAVLGKGTVDEPIKGNGCKRKQETVQVLRAGEIDPGVAVAVEGRPGSLFVRGARCAGYAGPARWGCLLEPLSFQGKSYTGAQYPPGPSRGAVPLGASLGATQLAGRTVTVARIEGVDPALAVGIEGRPHEAFVAPPACPYERFENAPPLDDLRRCLQNPVWLVFDPPGAQAGTQTVAHVDRPVGAALGGATVDLVRARVTADVVPADRTGAVRVARLSIDPSGNETLRFTVPDLKQGVYEAVVTCRRCAQSFGGRTVFPAGSMLVFEKPHTSSSGHYFVIALGVAFLVLAAAAVIVRRKGWTGRRRAPSGDASGRSPEG